MSDQKSLAKELVEAGVIFGQRRSNWNPKMKPYIFTTKNGISIIDIKETIKGMLLAKKFIAKTVASGKDVCFVGTKRQARGAVEQYCAESKMPYVTERWLGGTLTNFKTVKGSIKRLKDMETVISEGGVERMPKKEGLLFQREHDKLVRSLGGIKDMAGMPDAIFVIDVGYHKIAVTEANKLGIPVIGIVDTNHAPEGIDYIIPGNDDASCAVRLYARGLADVILEGRSAALAEIAKHADDEEEFVEVDESEETV